ncbi:hypothetical protein BLA29_014255 [Euroglyphus maynei]|uniref:Asparaginase n=1 Tax=Euroglyphus maynei TaxID=6958 RepID=A0A1Y3BDQ7_EURMA|nr:hypothetical protein BLA29_014255 [Euroglyphus maynei]
MTDKIFSEDSCDSDAELLNNLPLNGCTHNKTKNRNRRLSLNLAQTIPQQKLIDPSFEPKVLRKNKSIARIESYGTLTEESKVLVIYTGGTIGMVKNGSGGKMFFVFECS